MKSVVGVNKLGSFSHLYNALQYSVRKIWFFLLEIKGWKVSQFTIQCYQSTLGCCFCFFFVTLLLLKLYSLSLPQQSRKPFCCCVMFWTKANGWWQCHLCICPPIDHKNMKEPIKMNVEFSLLLKHYYHKNEVRDIQN